MSLPLLSRARGFGVHARAPRGGRDGGGGWWPNVGAETNGRAGVVASLCGGGSFVLSSSIEGVALFCLVSSCRAGRARARAAERVPELRGVGGHAGNVMECTVMSCDEAWAGAHVMEWHCNVTSCDEAWAGTQTGGGCARVARLRGGACGSRRGRHQTQTTSTGARVSQRRMLVGIATHDAWAWALLSLEVTSSVGSV